MSSLPRATREAPPLARTGAMSQRLVSPGCRRSKVKVARLYIGIPQAFYPNPNIDLAKERQIYQKHFAKLKNQLDDVDFVVDELVSSPEQIQALMSRI